MKNLPLRFVLLVLCLLICAGCAGKPAGSPSVESPEPSAPQPAQPSGSPSQPAVSDPQPAQSPEPGKTEISQENLGFRVMETLADFTFTTYDGREISLYETLAEKELVVLNFWATWCDPCEMEFPYMEQAYRQVKDSVEIFALSTESADTDDILAAYVAEHGMTFPVGQDSAGLGKSFGASSIPTTVLIDRNGIIANIEVGAKFSVEQFIELFTPFLGDDYQGFTPPEHLYCLVEPSAEEDLALALNAEGGSITFKNPDNKYVWPFVVTEHEGRSVVTSTNTGFANTQSVIYAEVAAEAGQVLFIDFALSGERGCDAMAVKLNGSLVKGFALDRGYGGYAIPMGESGVYDLEITYSKDKYVDEGEDCLRIDTVALLSGAEAEAALAANPTYLHHDRTAITALAEGAKLITLEDPEHRLGSAAAMEHYSFWLIPGGETELLLSLGEEVDPEYATIYTDYDASLALLLDCLENGEYKFSTGVDGTEKTGYVCTFVDMEVVGNGGLVYSAVLFTAEEDIDRVLTRVGDDGEIVTTWSYADGSPRETEYQPDRVKYTVSCVDEQGNPVAGVMVQVCDDSICQVYTSDDAGSCTFVLPPYAYEVSILVVPEGYAYDGGGADTLPDSGGSTQYVFKKTN